MSYTFKTGKNAGKSLKEIFRAGNLDFIEWVANNHSVKAARDEARDLLSLDDEYNNRQAMDEEAEGFGAQLDAIEAAKPASQQRAELEKALISIIQSHINQISWRFVPRGEAVRGLNEMELGQVAKALAKFDEVVAKGMPALEAHRGIAQAMEFKAVDFKY